MKKTLFYIVLACTFISINAQNQLSTQTLKYNDASLFFSKENVNGTARFNAMSGAFGALGGDLSSVDINPAGLTVFKESQSSISLNNHYIDTDTNFYGTINNSTENNFNLNHAGAVLVFDNNNDYWNKISLAFNYNLTNDFENNIIVNGNSGLSEFINDPELNFDNDNNNDMYYENTESQKINSISNGSNGKATFSFAIKYDKKTSFGLSIITNQIDYTQLAIFNEISKDTNDNLIDVESTQNLIMEGNGIGFNIGIIHKASKNLRLGLSYQSPTWYEMAEERFEDISIILSRNNEEYLISSDIYYNEYNLKTPSKFTVSFAYVFNKNALLSIDYSFKDYENIKISPNYVLDTELNYLKPTFANTNNLNIGGEYRLEKMNLRAGYQFNENPNKSIDNVNYGYSFGLGFNISEFTKLDFAYQKQIDYSNYNYFNDNTFSTNTINSNRLTATLIVGL